MSGGGGGGVGSEILHYIKELSQSLTLTPLCFLTAGAMYIATGCFCCHALPTMMEYSL